MKLFQPSMMVRITLKLWQRTAMAGLITLTVAASSTHAATLEVHDGESIQAAVNRAAPGDTLLVYTGTYRETVYI